MKRRMWMTENTRPERPEMRRGSSRRGMTLVELLVAVTILAILAALGFAAFSATRESARKSATRATVTKISDVITAKYESYASRKLPISSDQIDQLLTTEDFWTGYWSAHPDLQTFQNWRSTFQSIRNNYGSLSPMDLRRYVADIGGDEQYLAGFNTALGRMRALTRLVVLRDLIRLEMPERVADLWVMNSDGNRTPTRRWPVWSTVSDVTTTEMEYLWNVTDVENLNPAELLYLVVTRTEPEAVSLFHETEITDIGMASDGTEVSNGLKEFVDGWGKPIVFYRSMPGYFLSLIQSAAYTGDNGSTWSAMIDGARTPIELPDGSTAENGTFEQVRNFLRAQDPDPLDVMDVDPFAWRTVPVVVSAGPDGEFGMYFENVGMWKNQTFQLGNASSGGASTLYGSPMVEENGVFVHSTDDVLDNVTNHQPAEDL
ncbi:MAG: type II secretion system protein [Planctomycetia bacterium]|nr:type II secretion system protein [Planctomycetia bacterium]